MGDVPGPNELREIFRTEALSRVGELGDRLEILSSRGSRSRSDPDVRAIVELAHGLKGAAASLGLSVLAELSRELESAAWLDQPERRAALLADLRTQQELLARGEGLALVLPETHGAPPAPGATAETEGEGLWRIFRAEALGHGARVAELVFRAEQAQAGGHAGIGEGWGEVEERCRQLSAIGKLVGSRSLEELGGRMQAEAFIRRQRPAVSESGGRFSVWLPELEACLAGLDPP